MNVWEYLQTQDNKVIVIICPNREAAEESCKEIKENVLQHTLLQNRLLSTSTTLRYGTNRVICTSADMAPVAVLGWTIDVLLLCHDLRTRFDILTHQKIRHNLSPRAIIAKYRRNNGN